MAKAARLLALVQVLRRHRRPVTAARLASELGVSDRTVYRDIAALQAQGADIAGEAGVGYVLRPGFLLPPLMFSDEEIEALVLGARMAAEHGDPALSRAAEDALAKIADVLPKDLRDMADGIGLLAGPAPESEALAFDPAMLRAAIRRERKVRIDYVDAKDARSRRVIWPIAIGYFRDVRVAIAWCETKTDFRHFRLDRMSALEVLEARVPTPRRTLLRRWRLAQGIEPS
ncbi:MAG: YafY family transcriptional regulator [Tagaea sp.]|nr:YafY family transcriptional regulator [Tagaea sp.]